MQEEPLIEHLEKLRLTLIRCFIALGVMLIPMFVLAPYALDFLSGKLGEADISLHYFSPMEVFFLELKLAFLFDIVICFPFIGFQIWRFILPALYDDERRFFRILIFFSSFLFLVGVSFFLFVCFPLILQFGMSFSNENIVPVFGVTNIFSLGIWLSLAFGVCFQFPIVTYALVRSGIFSYEAISSKRPYVFVFILILSAFLTPPDVVSQLLLAIPTYALFELGLLSSRRYKTKPSLKEERVRKEIAELDVFSPNGSSRR